MRLRRRRGVWPWAAAGGGLLLAGVAPHTVAQAQAPYIQGLLPQTGITPAYLSPGGLTQGGLTQGGFTQGGFTQGGFTQGGLIQGGFAQGGFFTGGLTPGGVTLGGLTPGGVTLGGVTQGGVTQGGVTQGGVTPGGVAPSIGGGGPGSTAVPAGGHTPLGSAVAAPPFLVTTSINLQQEWTDNALPDVVQEGGRKQSSFITLVTPSLTVAGSTARLDGTLTYAPTLEYYASVSGQNQVAQNLSGDGHVTLVPDTLLVDLRAFANQQAVQGGLGPAGTAALSQQQLEQNYSFSVSPYLTHRFGGWGTAQLGVSDADTTQTTLSSSPFPGSNSNNQSLNTVQEYLSFASGENFGRVLSNAEISFSQSSASGAVQSGVRNTATYQAGYAITRGIVALASVGWEDISYSGAGFSPYRVNDATWSVGTRLTPNADSTITLLYGHHDGLDSATLDASYAPTARTRVYANYSEGVSTTAELLQNTLANAQFDTAGNPVDATTGAPLLLTDNFYGTSGTVYQVRSTSLSASWVLNRDSLVATVNRQQRTPVAGQTGSGQSVYSAADTGTYGSLAWSHELNPVLRGNLFGQYGTDDQGSGATRINSRLLVLSAGLSWQMNQTLTGSLQYSYTSENYQQTLPSYTTNLVVVGLRKAF